MDLTHEFYVDFLFIKIRMWRGSKSIHPTLCNKSVAGVSDFRSQDPGKQFIHKPWIYKNVIARKLLRSVSSYPIQLGPQQVTDFESTGALKIR